MTEYDEFQTNAAVVADVAARATEPTEVETADGDTIGYLHHVGPDGSVEFTDVEKLIAPYRAQPARPKGSYHVHDGPSLVKYLGKHAGDETEVWADVLSTSITGVINAHSGPNLDTGPGWGDHRVVYAINPTDAWKAWAAVDGKLMDQVTFAELIEDRAVDIIDPAAADMLEIVQQFQATRGVEFESSTRLSSGEAKLVYKETIDARTKSGELEVPQTFKLFLRPFEGAEPHEITARLRFRLQHKQLAIGFKLDRPADILRDAFEDVIVNVESQITWPVFRGKTA